MPDLDLSKLKPAAAVKIKPFLDEILAHNAGRIHSIHVTGTAVTDDFDDKFSDVNSVVVLKQMDLKFLEVLAPLGKKYGKESVAAPLVMTPEYIQNSLDVFPIEFLNFKLVHATVVGEDILQGIEDVAGEDHRPKQFGNLTVAYHVGFTGREGEHLHAGGAPEPVLGVDAFFNAGDYVVERG